MGPEAGRDNPENLSTRDPAFSEVYSVLEKAIEDRTFPGCAFGVLDSQGARIVDALGRQTYEPDAPRIEATTVYDLASLTKVLATTSMAMLLYERHLLDLDQPLVDILPEFAICSRLDQAESIRAKVTIRHLLAHSSGLTGYARLFESAHTREELLDACIHMPLQHIPGTVSEYSDIGFILLGCVLETLTGDTIDGFCSREIFTPLGMNETAYLPAPEARKSIPPTEEDFHFRHRVIQGEVQDENCWVMGGVSGHAGLFGSVNDILQFSRNWLTAEAGAHGGPTGSSLFQPDTVRLFSTRSSLPSGSSRALGWDTPSAPSSSGKFFSSESIGHLGYAGTSLWIDRLNSIAVVLLTNRTWPSRDNQRIRELRPLFHDKVREALITLSTNVG